MNNNKSKSIKLILIMTITMLLLTGCVKQDYLISVDNDGKVLFNISILIPNNIYETIDNYNIKIDKKAQYPDEVKDIEPAFRKMANQYLNEGFEIRPINDSFYTGFIAESSLKDVESFNILLNKLYKEDLSGLQGELIKSNKFFSTKYTFNGKLEYALDESINVESIDLDDLPFDPNDVFANVKIKLPGSFTAMEGFDEKNTDSHNAIFNINIDEEPKLISVVSKQNKENRMVIAITIFVILLITVGGRFISQKLRRRR